jgi:activator of HSP90 ATPase
MVVNNPNNWHWVDKNCIEWTRAYLKERLVGLAAQQDGGNAEVSAVSLVEGDVEVCQRKGKVISLFDVKITLSIAGTCGESFEGSIVVPELAYDSSADDLQFDVSIYNEKPATQHARVLVKTALVPQIRQVLARFGTDLIATHGGDIQLSSDKVSSQYTKANQLGATPANPVSAVTPLAPRPVAASPATSAPATSGNVPRYNTATLHLEPTFNTTAEQLYRTLLDPARLAAWTRSPPQIEPFPPSLNSSFKLFGGSISGTLTKLVPNEHITQKWRLEDWKEGHYAELDIALVQGSSDTKMVVKWSGIPIGQEDRVRENFENYYVRSIKITFGFGAVL